MSFDERHTSTATSRSHPATPEPGVPIITWVAGTAALLVVLIAGALFLDPSPHAKHKEGAATHPPERQEESPVVRRADALSTKSPLDITVAFLDAQERGKLWNPSAVLSGVELVIEGGKPKGPITFEFGEAIGQAIPGVPLSPKRLSLAYEDKNVDEDSSDSNNARVGLPEPNCPLEVAFQRLAQSGVGTGGRIGILYTHSQKHGKPVWLATDEHGQTTGLNADNCALLRR